jgi:hypothetical protein
VLVPYLSWHAYENILKICHRFAHLHYQLFYMPTAAVCVGMHQNKQISQSKLHVAKVYCTVNWFGYFSGGRWHAAKNIYIMLMYRI